MAQFSWTDDLHTGNALIDGDHRKLIGLLNALLEAMERGEASDAMGKAMNALVAYTRKHFAREEAEMARIQYVASLAHQSEHAKLIRQVLELKDVWMRAEESTFLPYPTFSGNGCAITF